MTEKRVLVIGAGKRARTAVLPALAALTGSWAIASVRTRGRKEVACGDRTLVTSPLAELRAEDVAAADLAIVIVSKPSIPGVLRALRRFDTSRLDLLLDTPVLLMKHLRHYGLVAGFRNAWVAEDCSTLPWIDAVRAAEEAHLGALQEVHFDRSAYHYHGHAMLKTLLRRTKIGAAHRMQFAGGARVLIRFRDGGMGTIVEPRDYATGSFRLVGPRGAATDARAPGARDLRLEATVEGERCTGFRIGDARAELAEGESELLGVWRAGDTPTSRMEDLKRVGLHRMLRAIHGGGAGYPVIEALDDMAVDTWLSKLGRYVPTPLTNVRSPVCRALLGAVGRLAGG